MLAVEKETFWGKPDEERCAFFVGISRAKQRLLVTYSQQREKPEGYFQSWRVNRNKYPEYWDYL